MNSVCLVGNLTKDPDLRHTPGGTAVGTLRVAVNEREKDSAGNWTDRPNYFDVTVWGNTADNCAQYLSKGNRVGVTGRLRWSEWEAQDGTKRQKVEIVAYQVDFLTPKGEQGGRQSDFVPPTETGGDDQFVPSGAGADDDIPF